MKKLIIKYLTTNHKGEGQNQWHTKEVEMDDNVHEITYIAFVDEKVTQKRLQKFP